MRTDEYIDKRNETFTQRNGFGSQRYEQINYRSDTESAARCVSRWASWAELSIMNLFSYSHLSNKREVTLTDFEKFHPPQKKSPLHKILFS